jgi:hypothetical protein
MPAAGLGSALFGLPAAGLEPADWAGLGRGPELEAATMPVAAADDDDATTDVKKFELSVGLLIVSLLLSLLLSLVLILLSILLMLLLSGPRSVLAVPGLAS